MTKFHCLVSLSSMSAPPEKLLWKLFEIAQLVGVLVDLKHICWTHFWEIHLGACFCVINSRLFLTKEARITMRFVSHFLKRKQYDYDNNWRHSASFLDTTVLLCLCFSVESWLDIAKTQLLLLPTNIVLFILTTWRNKY